MDNYILKVLRKSNKGLEIEEIIDKVINRIMKDNPFYSVDDEDITYIKDFINNLESEYEVFKFGDLYKHISKTNYHKGVYHSFGNGKGKIVETISYIDKEGNFITNNNEYLVESDMDSIDGDTVIGEIMNIKGSKDNKIIKIVSSDIDLVIGEVKKDDMGYYLKSYDDKTKNKRVPISEEFMISNRLVEGNIVTYKIDREDYGFIPTILKKNGHVNDPDQFTKIISYKHGMDDYFSKESIEEVAKMPLKVLDSERIGRSDLTDKEIFTIDGIHTKDMDDAVSIKVLDNGNYLLGVHIADVNHYVKKGSALDIDAYRKGNSTYADDSVSPMLCAELSNGICSINPNVDRLALSLQMEIDNDGNVVNYNLFKSVINSKKKMNYDDVNEILKNNKNIEGYEEFKNSLKKMEKLSLILRRKRIKDGSIEFEVGDRELLRDSNGNIIGAYERLNDVAENMIEEFMVIANEIIDKHLTKLGALSIHRVHDLPNLDKVNSLIIMLNALGYNFTKYSAETCVSDNKAMQGLSEYINNIDGIGDVLSRNLIKTMSKAKYSPDNIGHYALSKKNYCHFTSPIRRYSDLTVHRLLYYYEFGDGNKIGTNELYEIASHISQKERDAAMVESEVLDMKSASYMQNHVGEDFDGIITDVSFDKIKIILDNGMDGVVKTRTLKDYSYYPEVYSIISDEGIFQIGNEVNVKVLKNNDVLRENASLEELENYRELIASKPNKLDYRTTYLKINTDKRISKNKVKTLSS